MLVSLRQAVAEETLRFAGRDPLGAARKASQRPGFPEVAAWDGKTPSTTAPNSGSGKTERSGSCDDRQ